MADNFISRLKKRKEAAGSDEEKTSLFQQQLEKFKFDPDQINVFQDGFRPSCAATSLSRRTRRL